MVGREFGQVREGVSTVLHVLDFFDFERNSRLYVVEPRSETLPGNIADANCEKMNVQDPASLLCDPGDLCAADQYRALEPAALETLSQTRGCRRRTG